jgi:hypothetical protein
MPLPKALRRPVRRTSSASSAGKAQRRKCPTCNNLDPRGHVNSTQDAESLKEPRASLTLVFDALALANINSTTRGGCRFCAVLVQALDAFFEKWRGARCRVNVDIKEKETIKVGLDGAQWAKRAIEIYAGSGRRYVFTSLVSCLPCRCFSCCITLVTSNGFED